jgi:hypothetical protein
MLKLLMILAVITEAASAPNNRDWIDYTTLVIGIFLAAITGTGVIAAWRGLPEFKRQAEATKDAATAAKDSIDISRDTGKKQLRAYLCVNEACVKITENATVGGQPYTMLEGQLHINNGGQTPAYGVRSWIHGSIRPYPENTPIPPPPEGIHRSTEIIPSQGKRIFISKEIGESPQIIENLKSPNIAFYVQGEIHYRDIFKDWHCLKVRMMFGGPAGTRTTKDAKGVILGYLAADSWGNSDEDETQPNS